MEHSAEWYRGAVEALGRMVDDCDTVFDSDLPHITQGNLEDYLAEYAELLSAAEAREAGEREAYTVADCGWEGHDGHSPLYDPHCPHSGCPWCQGTGKIQIENTDAIKKQVASAAEVIRVAKAALEDIRAAVTTSTGQCGVMGTNWAECDYCGAVSQERMTPIPHEKGCAVSRSTEALATISAWEATNDR